MPLYRSRRHSIIAGVCGGIAEWLGWSVTMVRFLYILVSILSAAFPGVREFFLEHFRETVGLGCDGVCLVIARGWPLVLFGIVAVGNPRGARAQGLRPPADRPELHAGHDLG